MLQIEARTQTMSWQFQKFTLFNKKLITSPQLTDIITNTDLSCTSPCPTGQILFGSTTGEVHCIDHALQHSTIKAFQRRVNHLIGLDHNAFLCVGDDEPRPHDSIRLFRRNSPQEQWACAKEWKLSSLKNLPDAIVTTLARPKDKPSSSQAPHSNADPSTQPNSTVSQVAFGLGNGMIVLMQGSDIARGKASLRLLSGLSTPEPITGLGFAPFEETGNYCLYCVTPNAVFRYITSPRDVRDMYCIEKRDHDSIMHDPDQNNDPSSPASPRISQEGVGAGAGCSAVTEDGNLVIAHNSGFQFWNPEGRGSSHPYIGPAGKKVMIHTFKQYVVVVSINFVKQRMQQVITIYDFQSNPKYIAFKYGSDALQYGYIFDEWNTIFLIAKERKSSAASPTASEYTTTMLMLEEKDTKTKIETLTMKNQYKNAIRLVRNDPQLTADIYKSYGDHLYDKKDYNNAMEQYIHTVHYLEPSYVIRKFLDAQRITSLTKYLEVLHEQHLASSAHTTLLLNCYTKLDHNEDKKQKLDKFTDPNDNYHYDVDTAIKVCRQAGYLDHALKLARKHNQDDWYIKIHIEDKSESDNGNYKTALKYIEMLPFDKAESFLLKYAKVLLSKIPKRTTNVLIRLCTNWFPIDASEHNRRLDPSMEKMKQRISRKAQARAKSNTTARDNDQSYSILGVSRMGKDGDLSDNSSRKSQADHFIQFFTRPDSEGTSASLFWMMVFLEHVIIRNPKQPPQPKVVYNTLIETYLENKDNDGTDDADLVELKFENEEQEEVVTSEYLSKHPNADNYDILAADPVFQSLSYKKRLLELLQDPESNYDQQHVLVLVEEHNFKEGVLVMYEQRLHLHYDIMQHYMDEGDADKIIESCIKYGDNDPNIWIQVLTYFSTTTDKDYDKEIKIILNHIEKNNTLPPLLVVQILSKSRKTKIKTIKSYLSNRLQQEQRLIQNDMAEIKEFQKETEKMRTELHQLQTEAKIFQLTSCSLCNRALELPAVHFMCGHSYHQSCLPDADECYMCSKQNNDFLKRKRSYEESANNHEAFFKQLGKRAQDGFDIVSEMGFGRGVFGLQGL